MPACKRSEVKAGKVVIVECGDKTLHPLESKFIRPEVHNLMKVDRPLIDAKQTDRVVLWVHEALDEIGGTYTRAVHSMGCETKVCFRKVKGQSRSRSTHM
jgi:hypothetical protein